MSNLVVISTDSTKAQDQIPKKNITSRLLDIELEIGKLQRPRLNNFEIKSLNCFVCCYKERILLNNSCISILFGGDTLCDLVNKIGIGLNTACIIVGLIYSGVSLLEKSDYDESKAFEFSVILIMINVILCGVFACILFLLNRNELQSNIASQSLKSLHLDRERGFINKNLDIALNKIGILILH